MDRYSPGDTPAVHDDHLINEGPAAPLTRVRRCVVPAADAVDVAPGGERGARRHADRAGGIRRREGRIDSRFIGIMHGAERAHHR